jgi:hypothetical protein
VLSAGGGGSRTCCRSPDVRRTENGRLIGDVGVQGGGKEFALKGRLVLLVTSLLVNKSAVEGLPSDVVAMHPTLKFEQNT